MDGSSQSRTALRPAPFEGERPSLAPHRSHLSWRRRLRLPLLLAGPLLVLLIGGYLYLTGGRYVSTDDAYVMAARVSVAPQVAGQVVEVAVHDNQPVKKGDVLF